MGDRPGEGRRPLKRVWPLALFVAFGLAVLLVVLGRLQLLGHANHGHILQVHHGYLGAALAFACLTSLRWKLALPIRILLGTLFLLGVWWLGDDIYQHARQFSEPFYRSPWHRWAAAWGVI